jgi:transcription initiation factor TFIIIB Brf1 subunit/transcription initiation factor TFIIB
MAKTKSVCALTKCPECGSTNTICSEGRQQLTCKDCGLIYEPLAEEKKKAKKK